MKVTVISNRVARFFQEKIEVTSLVAAAGDIHPSGCHLSYITWS